MWPRNPRNNPHHRGGPAPSPGGANPLVRAWRWRTEIALTSAALLTGVVTATALGRDDWRPFLVATGAVSLAVVLRPVRDRIGAHLWCVVSRHRIQRVCLETGMHTAAGRIPLILWITPTALGEKALILTRAGICAEDFDAFAGELESACFARRVVVARHRRRADLVTLEIIRREGTTQPAVLLDRLSGPANWVPPRSAGGREEVPDTVSPEPPFALPREVPRAA
ncbi:hypothetical protein AB0D67_22565 [Streptosporangium sp. NPDC048047]|uniref:hypothetical protein n=1 Tax=Streptosporangium sp. NPDC048047 TaxID=3155748 RepID=UPI00341511E4